MKKFLLLMILCSTAFAYDVYVANEGNDAFDGSIEKPFATLEAARDAVRNYKRTGGEDAVNINIRGGRYNLTKTFELNEADSGTRETAVIYRSYQKEKVSITGGRRIDASAVEPVTDFDVRKRFDPKVAESVKQINLAKLGITNYGTMKARGFRRPYVSPALELFINSKAYRIARWPNEDFVPIGKVVNPGSVPSKGEYDNVGGTFTCVVDRASNWADSDNIWVSGTFNKPWSDATLKIAEFDKESNLITLDGAAMYGIASGQPWTKFYFLNVLEELDAPGEYYIDKDRGVLYFIPIDDITADVAIDVSLLDEPMVAIEGGEFITFSGITFEVSRGMGVYIERGRNNKLNDCTLANIGIVAVCIGQGIKATDVIRHDYTGEPISRELGSWHEHIYANTTFDRNAGINHGVENCEIYNTGAGAISLGGGNRVTLSPANNYVMNCDIHDYNRIDRTYRSGVNIDGVGNWVKNNHIHNAPAMAVYIHGNDHIIELNEIDNVMTGLTQDMGAIYLGRDPAEQGIVIRNNFLHNIATPEKKACGIYLDDGTSGVNIYGNVFYKVGGVMGVVMLNGGWNNKVENNIFVQCPAAMRASACFATWAVKHLASYVATDGLWRVRLEQVLNYNKPPYSLKYPWLSDFFSRDLSKSTGNIVSGNVFCRLPEIIKYSGNVELLMEDNFMTDQTSDFVDSSKMNFKLKADSKVYENIPCFKEIPFDKIGLHEDDDNKSNADKYANEPSSGKQLEEKDKLSQNVDYDPSQDMSLSSKHRAWELVLKQNLGDFYYPIYIKERAEGKEQAWDYVEDDPKLPRVLIIGDSISRGYTVAVRHCLNGKANVHRAPANCGPTFYGLEKLPVWLGEQEWDLITFNFGIHDRNTPLGVYEKNLEEIIARLRETGAQLLWVNSTPVPQGADEYVEGSIDRVNDTSKTLMQKNDIPVINLHDYIEPVIDEYQLPQNCHYENEGYEYMGQFVAEEILNNLNSNSKGI